MSGRIRVLVLSLLLTVFAVASACVNAPNGDAGGAATQPRANKDPNRKIKIGFAMDTQKESRWVKDKELFEKRAKELGADVEITVANNDDDRQVNDVENLLTKGVDVIVIVPHNATKMAASVDKAKAQGVPVISYDRLIKSDSIDLYVSHQLTKVGEMQTNYVIEKAPKGNYILVFGASTDNNALILKDAQEKLLKPLESKGDIKIIASQHAKDWSRDEAQKIVENALTQNNNQVAAVVASNDGTAYGAIQALKAQGLAGKVIVTGMDADLPALQSIAQGEQTMTVYKPIQPLAYGAVEAAIKLAKSETVTPNGAVKSINREIPSLLYEPKIIDKTNIMDVIREGFQNYDEVFANVPADQRPAR